MMDNTLLNARPHISLPLELWMEIADQIRNRQNLKSFAVTCRAFYKISQPLLYTERELHLDLLDLSENTKLLPPSLKTTRDFRVVFGEYQTSLDTEKYSQFLAKVLSQLENLRSFEWHDDSFTDEYATVPILSNRLVLKRLRNLPLLKHILIQFSAQSLDEDEPNSAAKCWIPLTGFTNLISLELYQFYSTNVECLALELAQALRESPNLKKLGLSMASKSTCNGIIDTSFLQHRGELLQELCSCYTLHGATQPLHLESLKLGNGFCLLKGSSETSDNYLSKLVKLDGLKTLHFFNGLCRFGDYDNEEIDFSDQLKIDCSLLEDCRSLYQVCMTRISLEIFEWLSGPARTVQELLVTDPYDEDDSDLDLFKHLKLKELSMLYVKDITWRDDPAGSDSGSVGANSPDAATLSDEEESVSDVDSSTDRLNEAVSSDDLIAASIDASTPPDLEEFPPGTDSSIRRPSVAFPSEDTKVVTILDRIGRNNDISKLTKLRFSMHYRSQWKHFLADILPLLKNLQQLHIIGTTMPYSRDPSTFQLPPLPIPGYSKSQVTALEYAKAIYKICPSLKYLAFGGRPGWHIQFCDSGEETENGPCFVPVMKEDLDLIEMFAWDYHAAPSGLLVQDHRPWPKWRPAYDDEGNCYFPHMLEEQEEVL